MRKKCMMTKTKMKKSLYLYQKTPTHGKNKRFRVLPYKQGSKSAKNLSLALGGKVLRLMGSKFKQRQNDVIINWGNSNPPSNLSPLNMADDIRPVSNKLAFFQLMKERGCSELVPPFWLNADHIEEKDFPVVCRTVLTGHSGKGIVISDNEDELVFAPLYTKYIKKKEEYRLHIGRSNNGLVYVFSTQRKAKKLSADPSKVNWKIRNHDNGFIYMRDSIAVPDAVYEAAKTCFEATDLDFGAVDVIWNEHKKRAYVLEINTAPGLEGQTTQDYAKFFKQ
jgi:uncharacterized protein YlzI (FlbEa/FlbD family)